ncbi:hypothetical protein BDY21DRAFT_386626 [Lineolata rhizophorae]|uniref:Uncharacterized protein n=1 Tax=Lineolata rhizophorae TaxID=578093 RepID=A0A6A6NXJ9_9PEZI|nr:hypothetical protein BDY21DRAFT_386626 [Lineolata rhizophorae]
MAQAASRNRGIERRRSSVRINLTHNDPTIPSPGEMAMSPGAMSRHGSMSFNNGGGGMGGGHAGGPHGRTPSLGELHQELENEQEFQVNRLLNMIRQQQAQITNLTAAAAPNNAGSSGPASATAAGHAASAIAIDDSTTPTSERSMSLPHHPAGHPQQGPLHAAPRARSPAVVPQQQQGQFPPQPASRTSSYGPGARSRGSSRVGSPALRPGSASSGTAVAMAGAGAPAPGGAGRERDESAFYQAETQMLTRENQMLKLRIRELGESFASHADHVPLLYPPTVP